MKEDMFILNIISRTKVTVWGRPVILSCCLIAKGVNMESQSSHAVNDIMGKVKELVFRETLGGMHIRGPVCRRSREGKGYIAVPACRGSLAEAK
eukprot:1151362-Pelagomonas_calceolata.AAC.11